MGRMGRMGKHEEKEGGRQYIRSILTLTVIFNSAPRFAKWAEFLCSPRTYSFQIGCAFSTRFLMLHLFFSYNSSIKSPRKDNDAHCCQTFIHNTDFLSFLLLAGQLLRLCIPWQRSGVSSPAPRKRQLQNIRDGTHFEISRLQQTICICIYLTKKFSTYRD